jgi:hypothetical protein
VLQRNHAPRGASVDHSGRRTGRHQIPLGFRFARRRPVILLGWRTDCCGSIRALKCRRRHAGASTAQPYDGFGGGIDVGGGVVVTDGLGGQFCPQSWCPWVHDGSSPGASRRGSCVVVSPRQARHPAWLRADSFPFWQRCLPTEDGQRLYRVRRAAVLGGDVRAWPGYLPPPSIGSGVN